MLAFMQLFKTGHTWGVFMKILPIAISALITSLAFAHPAFANDGDSYAVVNSGNANASVGGSPVTASANSYGGHSSSFLLYRFQLSGLDALVPAQGQLTVDIPLQISYAASLSGFDSNNNYYSATASISAGTLNSSFTCNFTDQSGCGTFSYTDAPFTYAAFPAPPGGSVQGIIFLQAAAINYAPTGYASAMIDPVLSFDPAFLQSNPGASISYSPVTALSVGVSPVPEPAVWMTMVAGLGMVGGQLRSRRRKAALAA